MILQALFDHYEALVAKGKIARSGWGKTRIQYALKLDGDGQLLSVLPLEDVNEKGKPIPRYFELPAPVKRTVGIASNFLWDNATYLLGADGKGKPERAVKCFEAAKALHLSLLSELDDPFARAICAFFRRWRPEDFNTHPALTDCAQALMKGANLTFIVFSDFPQGVPALAEAWQSHYDGDGKGANALLRCLVTGELAHPELTHPAIKKVRGAQSSGAALVSFNAPAFCSYAREQNLNAPVSKYAAFAYTTALNHLLDDNRHTRVLGDTTLVYWAENAEPHYQDAFGCMLDGDSENKMTDSSLKAVMATLAAGKRIDWDGLPLECDNRFFVLGLAPNAARLSVRFFLQNTFGGFAENLNRHYERLEIVRPEFDKFEYLPLWKLLGETVNSNARDKSASPQMAGDALRAILTDTRYPATLYQQTMLRIRAEQKVTRGRAAILKAYLLKNATNETLKEAITVALNEQSEFIPYVLGRLFSLLENIQDSATGASTVKDSYFSAACATPAVVFPRLLKLKNSHTKVLMRDKPGLCITLEKQVTELIGRLDDRFPAHLTLEEQGAFILGYYHQTQKRFEKKDI